MSFASCFLGEAEEGAKSSGGPSRLCHSTSVLQINSPCPKKIWISPIVSNCAKNSATNSNNVIIPPLFFVFLISCDLLGHLSNEAPQITWIHNSVCVQNLYRAQETSKHPGRNNEAPLSETIHCQASFQQTITHHEPRRWWQSHHTRLMLRLSPKVMKKLMRWI